ncbi:MAG: hypothetical protein BA866_11290 [Desulfobulbaceae bacterium S5133MH15]|nr:MAG: hypothetical protein BA866_11290 [Desulfobulbaceae bacterium S5133MH15]OEU82761.1 MAG: hypothetical protein BA873_03675 [Desulfobulbaceae bacterium C00003063]
MNNLCLVLRLLLVILIVNIGFPGVAVAGGFCEPFRQSNVPQYVLNTMIDAASAGHLYLFQPEISQVGFSIDSTFMHVDGKFTKIEGGIAMESGVEHKGQALFAIRTDSVSTSNPLIDCIIKSNTFLDVENYPQILFISTGFKWLSNTTGHLKGKLTLHGVTKPVAFNVKLSDSVCKGVGKSDTVVAKISTSVNRTDFGMNEMKSAIGDTVVLSIRVHAKRSKLLCLQCHG